MQQLAGILEAEFTVGKKYPFIQKMIERDNPKIETEMISKYRGGNYISNLAYDFGGGEDPVLGKNVTVVDLDSYGWEDEIEDFKFIEADLTKKQNLSPVDLITATSFVGNVLDKGNIQNIVYNIDNSLNKGGLFFIHDFPIVVEKLTKYLQSYKLLTIYWNEYDGQVAEALFKK